MLAARLYLDAMSACYKPPKPVNTAEQDDQLPASRIDSSNDQAKSCHCLRVQGNHQAVSSYSLSRCCRPLAK